MTVRYPEDAPHSVDTCERCQRLALIPDGSTECPDCSRPVRWRRRPGVCSCAGCDEPVLQRFGIDVEIEDDPTPDSENAQMIGETVDQIIRGIILIEGGLCEHHLSERFESMCARFGHPQEEDSAFDQIFRDIRRLKIAERDKKFKEEWL